MLVKKREKIRKSIGATTKGMLCGLLVFALLFQTTMIPTFALDIDHHKQIITAFEELNQTEYTLPLNADQETIEKILTFPSTLTAIIEELTLENSDANIDINQQEDLSLQSIPEVLEETHGTDSKDVAETETMESSMTETTEIKIEDSKILAEPQVKIEKQELEVNWNSERDLVTGEEGIFIYTSELKTDDYVLNTQMPQITVVVKKPVSEDTKVEDASSINKIPEINSIVETPANVIEGEDELQALHKRIQNLSAPTADELDEITLNEREVELDVGEKFQLQLVDDDGAKIDGVKWFCRTRYPYDVLYTAEQFSQEKNCCSLSNDGLVIAKEAGGVEVWAKWQNALYKCDVLVKSESDRAEDEAERAAEEIAKDMMHLSDVDKVMAAHDYLVEHVEYARSHLLRGAYGALVEGKAVCAGYAQAFQKLMNKLNIESSVVRGKVGDEGHAWNRVKLDGEWYYLDVTWDDQPNMPMKRYKYFLLDKDTFKKSHDSWYSPPDEITGTKYRYYAYKKLGLFAENKEELETVLKAQIDSSNSKNMYVSAVIPQTMDSYTIQGILRKIAGSGITINEKNEWGDRSGDYHLYCYEVKNINALQPTEVKFLDVKSGNGEDETTSKLVLTFNKNIDNLSVNDIVIKGVDKRELKQIGDGIYELSISNIIAPTGKEITVQVNKRGFEISPDTHSIRMNIVKEATPSAVFKAIDDRMGMLENLEVGMKYTVGDGVWHEITSTEPVLVKTIYLRPILVIKTSKDSSKMDSEAQIIMLKNPHEPRWVGAVDCTGNIQNGKIIHVSRQMEYQRKNDTVWTSCTGREVTGLASGEYYVRYKANGISMASGYTTVHIDVLPIDNNTGSSSSSNGELENTNTSSSTPDNGSSQTNTPNNGSSQANTPNNGSSQANTPNNGFSQANTSDNGASNTKNSHDTKNNSNKKTTYYTYSTKDKKSIQNNVLKVESTNENTLTFDVVNRAIVKSRQEPKRNGITVDLNVVSKNTQKIDIKLPKETVDHLVKEKISNTVINSNIISFMLDLDTLKEIQRQAVGDVTIVARKVDTKSLIPNTKALVGSRPMFDLAIMDNTGAKISDFGKGIIYVSLPYRRDKNEKSANILAYYVDSNGTAHKIANSIYNEKAKTLSFATNHFSKFAVGYEADTANIFSDLKDHWAKESIEFITARELLGGKEENKFSPETPITREEFAEVLGRIAAIDTKEYSKTSFTDVKQDMYSMPYIEWVAKNHIMQAMESEKFSPQQPITREQAAMMIQSYIAIMGFDLPISYQQVTFTDDKEINSNAQTAIKQMQTTGIMVGKNSNKFDPKAMLTRAEMSTIVKRFIEVLTDGSAAQGWFQNHSGKWLYYKDGKVLTGKQIIGGVTYVFNQYGESDTQPNLTPKSYTVQTGDSFWRIANKYDVPIFDLTVINGKKIDSMIHPGDILTIPN